jgi:hypothetical protein
MFSCPVAGTFVVRLFVCHATVISRCVTSAADSVCETLSYELLRDKSSPGLHLMYSFIQIRKKNIFFSFSFRNYCGSNNSMISDMKGLWAKCCKNWPTWIVDYVSDIWTFWIVQLVWFDGWDTKDWVPALHCIQTGPEAHTASYVMATRNIISGGKLQNCEGGRSFQGSARFCASTPKYKYNINGVVLN